jgi:aminomethyltransferase
MSETDATTAAAVATTPLHALHRELGATMTVFAGYDMPLRYPAGILQEHLHTRRAAGLFDVSHMGQLCLRGVDPADPAGSAARALETLVPADLLGLAPGQQRYTLLTNAACGVRDDLMVVHAGECLLLVVNAACKHADFAYLAAALPAGCELRRAEDRALLALQGPQALPVMTRLAPALARLPTMHGVWAALCGQRCFVTRSGYTGEDGVEISVPVAGVEALARWLLAQPEVAPVGLGARDSLRLEAGLCLYGQDLDPQTTLAAAGLAWVVGRARRPGGARAGGYPGADVFARELAEGTPRQRVRLRVEGRAPVRAGVLLYADDVGGGGGGGAIGVVTSGGFGPSVGAPVAMGYVGRAHAAVGARLFAEVRGKRHPLRVVRRLLNAME